MIYLRNPWKVEYVSCKCGFCVNVDYLFCYGGGGGGRLISVGLSVMGVVVV